MKKKREMPSLIIPKGVKILVVNQGRSFSVWVEGASRMLLCLPSCVRVLLKNKILCLHGRGMLCTAYGSGALEVTGEIEEIKFEACKREKEGEGL